MDEAAARAAFEQAITNYKQDFGTFFLAKLFGLDIQYDADSCVVSLDLKDFMFNPQGTLHGGVIAFVMDISMGHLLYRSGGPGTTLEMKIQYVKPAKHGLIRCTGRFIRHGGSISFLRSELRDENDELLAFATATWKALKPRPHKTAHAV